MGQVWTRLAETAKKGDMKIVLQEMGVYFQQKSGPLTANITPSIRLKKTFPGKLIPHSKKVYPLFHIYTSSDRNLKRQVLIVSF